MLSKGFFALFKLLCYDCYHLIYLQLIYSTALFYVGLPRRTVSYDGALTALQLGKVKIKNSDNALL